MLLLLLLLALSWPTFAAGCARPAPPRHGYPSSCVCVVEMSPGTMSGGGGLTCGGLPHFAATATGHVDMWVVVARYVAVWAAFFYAVVVGSSSSLSAVGWPSAPRPRLTRTRFSSQRNAWRARPSRP